MNLLKRELAPILPEAWELIDQMAQDVLRARLAGRKVVDVDGPHGWELSAVDTGRLDSLRVDGNVSWSRRRVLPLVELRVPIVLDLAELDAVGRGLQNPDLTAVERAAAAIAMAEDRAVFQGVSDAEIHGMLESSPLEPISISNDRDYARAAVRAVDVLRRHGNAGPFAMVLGQRLYEEVFSNPGEGYPVAKQLRSVVGDSLVLATSLSNGAVVSLRRGGYELVLGTDLSIGYQHHDQQRVHLYLTEAFVFRVLDEKAAVVLNRAG